MTYRIGDYEVGEIQTSTQGANHVWVTWSLKGKKERTRLDFRFGGGGRQRLIRTRGKPLPREGYAKVSRFLLSLRRAKRRAKKSGQLHLFK